MVRIYPLYRNYSIYVNILELHRLSFLTSIQSILLVSYTHLDVYKRQMLYNAMSLRTGAGGVTECTLHITIPENLDYTGVFDPVLAKYTRRYSLTQVKTTNMGSLFKLTYDLTLKDPAQQKKMCIRGRFCLRLVAS